MTRVGSAPVRAFAVRFASRSLNLPDSTNVVTGLPADQFEVELAARSVTLTLAESIYPLEAIYGASYTFIDRCYVLLDRS